MADDRIADDTAIDTICEAFAGIVDAKSPYTNQHSRRVTKAATEIGKALGLRPKDLVVLRRAGLLHDIGKLGVSNAILDKPGKLTAAEWEAMGPVMYGINDLPPKARAAVRRLVGRPRVAAPKRVKSFKLSPDLIAAITSSGKGYNTRVESALRKALEKGWI